MCYNSKGAVKYLHIDTDTDIDDIHIQRCSLDM